MNPLRNVLSLSFLLLSTSVLAQSYSDIANQKSGNYSFTDSPLVGLWEVMQVTVDKETLTPTAKWFKFLSDGTMEAGNGWVQNTIGSYNYDQDTQQLLQANNGKVDEYGAFQISIAEHNMTWKRTEDGLPVVVSLVKVTKKPLGPWDLIVGTWKTKGAGPNAREIRFRWDRIFIDNDHKVSLNGVWHIAAHYPTLTLFYTGNGEQKWKISFANNQMIWTSENGNDEKLIWRQDAN